jgi:hypothetical protein
MTDWTRLLWRRHLAESSKVVLGDRTTATVVELLS